MKPRLIHHRWTFHFPDHLADWDVWEYWEQARCDSMEANLTPGMVLYDVGAEHGSLSAVYAQFVGGDSMVLMEPSPEFWPNIRKIWEGNDIALPKATYVGLLGDVEADAAERDFDPAVIDGWPECAWRDEETPAMPYRYLHNESHVERTPRTTLDAWWQASGIAPDAITMDVEGAEHLVLAGASRILTEVRPLVWVSLHHDLMLRDFGADAGQVYVLMARYGYQSRWIATDHESHVLFWHPDVHDPVLP